MMYYSTNDKSHRVDARQAIIAGLAPDGGLYMPEVIPRLSETFYDGLADTSFHEIGRSVANAFFGDVVSQDILERIVMDAIDFEIPLVHLPTFRSPTFVLELFHGSTFAFKDVGARFMARLMSHFIQGEDRELTILVATSGDTGSAVAQGFYGVPGVRVVVLYPGGKVSDLQEAQITTLGGNVIALKIDGAFDDCQRLVKKVFLDAELTKRLLLSSANSINIARLIPQSFYYFWAVAQLRQKFPLHNGGSGEVIVSVPSGNFGNLTAGLIAKRMGLSIKKFIAATNANDVVPEYLETGIFRPRPSIATISNAMDVGSPSNFVRMLELYPTVDSMCEDMVGIRVTEEETRTTIARVFANTGYVLDPHGAVACAALVRYGGGIFLETAHPAKFKKVVEEEISQTIAVPERLSACLRLPKQSVPIPNDFGALKEFLL